MATLSVTTAAFIMEIRQGPGGRSVCARAGAGEQGLTACGSLSPLAGSPSPASLSQGGGVGIPSPLRGVQKAPPPANKTFPGLLEAVT